AFCPDERVVAMGAGATASLWWNRDSQPRNGGMPAHAAPISCVSFSPDARFAITAERGGLVRLWALPTIQMVASIPFTGSFSGGRFSRDGKYVMASGSNYTAGDLR